MSIIFFLIALFNFYGFTILLMPATFKIADGHAFGFTSLSDWGILILVIFLFLFLFFGLKKFLEIDYEGMRQDLIRRKQLEVSTGLFREKDRDGFKAKLLFKSKYLKKMEKFLYQKSISIAIIILGPFAPLGSVLAHQGNTPLLTFLLTIMAYALGWITFWISLGFYALWKVLSNTQQEFGKKLNLL